MTGLADRLAEAKATRSRLGEKLLVELRANPGRGRQVEQERTVGRIREQIAVADATLARTFVEVRREAAAIVRREDPVYLAGLRRLAADVRDYALVGAADRLST